jgi:hypothetical protein
VARLGDELTLEGRALSLDAFGRATPELAATATGFAILAPMRTCEPPATECANQAPIPTMVRTDAHLSAVQREPFAFGTDPASMAWGLTCEADRCLALAASGASPARVRAADISPHVNLKPVPEPAPPPKDAPRVADLKAVQSGESVVDLAAARMGDATLLALLSARPDAPAHPSHAADESPRLATYMLTTRVVDAAGASSTPVLITKRALAVGGVSIAAAEKAEDGGAVAWIARENGDPEVHVTRIDKKGKRTNDVQLTTTKGDASDVSITWAGGGWVVAWVDGRDGNGEVYATKVGLDLTRTAREERITTAPGDASDLVALARGDLVWLAWADPRDSQADGMADIFVTAIGARDAKRTTVEHRVLATAAHSRTPQLAPGPNGVHVAWIEESPMGSERPEASGYGALWGTLDRSGKLVTKPAKLPLAGEGAATSVVLDTGGGALHALVARSGRDAITIDAIDLGGRSRAAYPLLTLDGPPSLDVALVMEGGILYFNDDGPTPADKRARRARIAWSPPAP